ncbi:hypothetical protein ABPG74_016988 [Tetrahymena malaccensis]
MSNQHINIKKYGGNLRPLPVQWLEGKEQVAACFGTKLCLFSTKTGYLITEIDANSADIISYSINASKNFDEAYTLDQSGKLVGIDLRTSTVFSEYQFKDTTIVSASFDSSCSKLFYIDQNSSLHVFKISKQTDKVVYDFASLSTSSENKQNGTKSNKEQEQLNEQQKSQSNQDESVKQILVITKDEMYALISVGKKLVIVELEDQKVFRVINHPLNITALACSPSTIAVGDEMGKITYYHQAFELSDFSSSSVHWHSLAVKSLAYNQDYSLLFSGGEEGVLLIWHQYEDKKDFYPRLGSEIMTISVSPENDLIGCSLRENSIQFLQVHNFETQFNILGFTNPQAYPQVQCSEDMFCNKIVQNQESHLICLNSLPGRIQFLSLFEQRKIKDFDVVSRNLTSRSGSYLPDPSCVKIVQFDKSWKDMLTVSERNEDQISLSCLKFWQENQNLNYDCNTRIEYAHGAHIYDAVCFFSHKSNTHKFITYGSDNKFKIWKKYTRIAPNSKSGEVKVYEYFWNCEFEGSYKNKKILGVQHYLNDEDKDIIAVLAEDVYLQWNISDNKIEKTINVGIQEVKRFEINLEHEQIFLMSKNTFKVINTSGQTLIELNMESYKDLSFEKSLNQISLLIVSDKKTSGVITLSTKNFQVISAYAIPSPLNKISYIQLETRKVLVGLDLGMNFMILDDHFKEEEARKYLKNIAESSEYQQEQQQEAEKLQKNEAYKMNVEAKQQNFSQKYQTFLNYQYRQDFKLVSEFYNEKSHLIPPSGLVFNQFFDNLMLKNQLKKEDGDIDIFANFGNMEIEDNDQNGHEESDDEEEENGFNFEKQQNKLTEQENKNNKIDQQQINHVNDKWIKETHKYIENLFNAQYS